MKNFNKRDGLKRVPYDHVFFKNTLTTKLGGVLVDDVVNKLGVSNYQFDVLEEVKLNNHRRLDAVLLVRDEKMDKNEYLFSIGLELKQHTTDLKTDKKILEYLGYTDFFFLWLEDRNVMREIALERYSGYSELGVIMHSRRDGLLKLAKRQIVKPENKLTNKQIREGRLHRAKRLKYISENREKKRSALNAQNTQ